LFDKAADETKVTCEMKMVTAAAAAAAAVAAELPLIPLYTSPTVYTGILGNHSQMTSTSLDLML